ncbi:TPA: hypothetical protein ACX6Q6_003547 [Photobacterium damselae]
MVRSIKRHQMKKQLKAKKRELRDMKAENKIRANRIGYAAFYRQYNPLEEQYEYIMKAKRLDEQFEAHIPCEGERDRYKEMVMLFTIMCRDWKWQQPDCLSYFSLIEKHLAETGDYKHYEEFMSLSVQEEETEESEASKTSTECTEAN